MIKWRKIYLYIIAVIFAGLEVFSGVTGYNDRGGWFEGLGALLLDIFLIPILLGLLYGIFEATDCFDSPGLPVFEFNKSGFRKLGFSALRMLLVALMHGVISPIVYIFALDAFDEYFDMCGIMLLFSLGIGLCAFLAVYILAKLIFTAVREFILYNKNRVSRNQKTDD